MPEETARSISAATVTLPLWIVSWKIGDHARLMDAHDITSRWFYGENEGEIQIFLGNNEISVGPVWREVNGKQLLDFRQSYAVQVVPSIYAKNHETLLQGSLSTFNSKEYDDERKAKALAKLYQEIKKILLSQSDRKHVITQPLPNDSKKFWKDICVGKQVVEAYASGLRLKQFLRGEVEFRLESI